MSNIFVISAPSGAGKSTLINELLARDSALVKSLSITTRPIREGEVDGFDYIFTTEADFRNRLASGEFIEYANVHGNWYGTSRASLSQQISKDCDVLLEIDVQGAAIIRELFPDSVSIFVLPPDRETLRMRLENRQTDSRNVIERRLKAASDEITRAGEYQYAIINDELYRCVGDLQAIIQAARMKGMKNSILETFGKI
jgi:guanylate kinase